jgi:pyochelin biosynthetic protein PchC
LDEPPPTDILHVAAEAAEALVALADVPLALFGHSMGAPIALETARLLEAGGVPVTHLFASGSRDADETSEHEEEETPEEAIAKLISLGGTEAEFALDPDFQELVLPYVLADSRMFRAYRMAPLPLLRCPVTTIIGDIDAAADRRPWSALTDAGHVEHVVRGDHFYLRERPPYGLLRRSLTGDGGLTLPRVPGHARDPRPASDVDIVLGGDRT